MLKRSANSKHIIYDFSPQAVALRRADTHLTAVNLNLVTLSE
jgi:hypothetical protein